MMRPTLNLQDQFLNAVRRENLEISIIMLDGSNLQGRVKGFDNFTVVISSPNGAEHLIYKHAIAQLISPKVLTSGFSGPAPDGRPPQRQGGREGSREGQGPRFQGAGGGGRPPQGPGGGQRSGPPHREDEQKGSPAEASSEAPPSGGGEDRGGPRSGGDGFNKIDLSSIKKS